MIVLKGTAANGSSIVILGLSYENLRRLRADEPIRVDLSKVGLPGEVYIFSGPTEDAMVEKFKEHVGPKSVVVDTRKGRKT